MIVTGRWAFREVNHFLLFIDLGNQLWNSVTMGFLETSCPTVNSLPVHMYSESDTSTKVMGLKKAEFLIL